MRRSRIIVWTTLAVLLVGMAHTAAAQDDGAAPMAEHSQHSGDYLELPPGGIGTATVTCPGGTQPTGGGFRTTAFDIQVTDSAPDGFGWMVIGRNVGSTPESLRAVVICTVP